MTILYHYCPTNSFYSIVENKSIWLTSLSQSNDYMEGRLASLIIARLAQKDNLNLTQMKLVQDWVQSIEVKYDGLGFCLSEEPDLLSQWRGYASDATGVAVGFSTEYLNWLAETTLGKSRSIILKKVIYDTVSQDLLAESAYNIGKEIEDELSKTPRQPGGTLESDLLLIIKFAAKFVTLESQQLFKTLFMLKSEAFKEELEWRLISYLSNDVADVCSYRLRNNMMTSYQIIELSELNRLPIVEVILGPKHQTPVNVVKNFLKSSGFGDVKVIQSIATYR